MIDDILKQAVDQAMNGKGKRHGGSSVPWLEQPWKVYADVFGEGFLKGQAVKKNGGGGIHTYWRIIQT